MPVFHVKATFKREHVVRVEGDDIDQALSLAAMVAADFESSSSPGYEKPYEWAVEEIGWSGDTAFNVTRHPEDYAQGLEDGQEPFCEDFFLLDWDEKVEEAHEQRLIEDAAAAGFPDGVLHF